MFDFNKDYEAELIQNTEWVWQTFQAIQVLEANNCYPDLGAGASHAWGRMNVEVANWTEENYKLINHLEVNYRWLSDRYPTHPLTQAIAGYVGKSWFFLQVIQQNKKIEEVKKEVSEKVKEEVKEEVKEFEKTIEEVKKNVIQIPQLIILREKALKKALKNKNKMVKMYAGVYFYATDNYTYQFSYNQFSKKWDIERGVYINEQDMFAYSRYFNTANTLKECKDFVE